MKNLLTVLTCFFLVLSAKAELTEVTNKEGKTIKVKLITYNEEIITFTMAGKSGVKTLNLADLDDKTKETLKLWKSQGKDFSDDLDLVSFTAEKTTNKTAANSRPNQSRNTKNSKAKNSKSKNTPKAKSVKITPSLVIRNRDRYKSSNPGSVYLYISEGSNKPLKSPITLNFKSIPPNETIELEARSLTSSSYKGYALFITNSKHEILIKKGSLHGTTKKAEEALTAILANKQGK